MPDRGRRDDALQVGVVLEEGLGLVEGLLVLVVAVDRVDQLDVGVVGVRLELGLHHLDPGVLVGRVGRRREDRDLAGAADLLRDQLELLGGDALGGGLVDEQVAALRVGVGVEGDDLDARVAGLADGVTDRLRVVGRDDEPVGTLLGDRVDEGHLAGGVVAGLGTDLLDRRADLLGRRLRPAGAGVEVGVAEVLGEHGEGHVAAAARRCRCRSRPRRHCRSRRTRPSR